MKKIYMLNSYLVNGESFDFNDNHGSVVRCEDCKNYDKRMQRCVLNPGAWDHTDFCSKGRTKGESE